MLTEFGERILFKPEATPIGPRLSALRDATRGRARIFEGSGGIALVESFQRGIVGTMPGAEMIDGLVALWRALESNDQATVDRVFPLICALVSLQIGLDGFLAIEKHLLVRQGIFRTTRIRGPVAYQLDDFTRAKSTTGSTGSKRRWCRSVSPRAHSGGGYVKRYGLLEWNGGGAYMKSPFPGMDPYLEKHWRDVHARLIIYACDQMQRSLPGELLARVEERVFVESEEGNGRSVYPDVRVVEHGRPGVAAAVAEPGVEVAEPWLIHARQAESATETFIEIIDAGSGGRIVTVIEFLSQANKQPGDGQEKYLQKQGELRAGKVNLVEIDLLRAGQRVFMAPADSIPHVRRAPYQACVWRARKPGTWEHYAFPLARPLPAIPIPLREQDNDVLLRLQPLIELCYENGRYQTLDYRQPPDPPLAAADATWSDHLLRDAGKR